MLDRNHSSKKDQVQRDRGRDSRDRDSRNRDSRDRERDRDMEVGYEHTALLPAAASHSHTPAVRGAKQAKQNEYEEDFDFDDDEDEHGHEEGAYMGMAGVGLEDMDAFSMNMLQKLGAGLSGGPRDE